MRLSHFFQPGRVGLSIELFPPKTSEAISGLVQTVQDFRLFKPDFLTCTYGAGGSTQDMTLQVAEAVKQQMGLPMASHLTCVNSTKEQLRQYLRRCTELGIEAIVALRGDPPKGETSFTPIEGGLRHASELVELIQSEFPSLGIAVAGYPEVHQEAISAEDDLRFLKQKVDCGADVVVTQLFYDNSDFFRFRDRCNEAGIHIPIVPGILPVTNYAQIQRITTLCKAKLPETFASRLAMHDDPEWQFQTGVEFAQQQVEELLRSGIPGIHFYVLNKSKATCQVLQGVGWNQSVQP
jgi:methylenetetrahydrofolate reductase (NADPH)